MTRSEILDRAETCVNGDRQNDYGTPERNFETIADLWNAYIGEERFSPKDVAAMLILLKIARIASGKKKDDNWIDIAGYAACGGEIEDPRPFNDILASAIGQTTPLDHIGTAIHN